MPTSEQILEDLRKTFGRRAVLFSEDVAELLGSDHRVVKSLLKGTSLPLDLKKVGNRWGVSIYSVAEWLAETDQPSKKTTTTATTTRLKTPARARASLGRAILALQTQRNFLDELISELSISCHIIDGHLDEERSLSDLSGQKTRPRRLKGHSK